MAMTGFICHDDYYDRLIRLSDEEVGHLFRQLMLYHAGREDDMTDFIGMEGIAFDFIASDIDRMEEKQNAASETNRINGAKGGRPKKQTEPEETEENRMKPTETEENPTKPYKDKDKDKEKEKDKDNVKESVREKKPLTRFTPPTREEVAAYCRERGNRVDANRFVDYYTANGWRVGKNPMKDWRATVRTWERADGMKQTVTLLPAHQYEQRNNTGAQAEAIEEMRREIARAKEAGLMA